MKVVLALEGLRVPVEMVVRLYDSFDNNLGIKNIFYNIFAGVVPHVLMNISPSNTFRTILLSKKFHLSRQAVVG